jgi:hypothetical protein
MSDNIVTVEGVVKDIDAVVDKISKARGDDAWTR